MVEQVAAPISLWARRYIETFGLALVAIEPGSKGPKGKGWNQPGGYITDAAEAEGFWQQNPRHNMGVVLGPSRVCSLDVDDVECTRQVLWDLLEVDLDALAVVYPTAVGNPERFRILFRVPDGVELSRHALSWPLRDDPSKRFTVVEFRAGLVRTCCRRRSTPVRASLMFGARRRLPMACRSCRWSCCRRGRTGTFSSGTQRRPAHGQPRLNRAPAARLSLGYKAELGGVLL